MSKRISIKKILAMAAALIVAVALASCTPGGELAVDSDDHAVHAKATNSVSGTAISGITIEEGYGLCINHVVEKGSFHVKATDESGKVVFDADITNNIADFIDAQGYIDLAIEAKQAVGTLDIIPYDIAAQAQADATLDEALDEMNLDRDALGSSSSSASSTS